MHRGYTRDDYWRQVEWLRRWYPMWPFQLDLIVGFPGESDDDFMQTLELVKAVEFDAMYLFKYSPRPGTRATTFGDQIPDAVKSERFNALIEVQEAIQLRRNRDRLDDAKKYWWRGEAKGSVQLTGRTRQNRPVNFVGHPSLTGSLVTVRIEKGASTA